MVLLFAPDSTLLILKPSFKSGWTLPGGTVDEGESPLVAGCREVTEEVGLKLSGRRLVYRGLRYVHPTKAMKDYMQLFYEVRLTQNEAASIVLNKAESTEYRWVRQQDLAQYADHPRMQAVIAFLDSTAPVVYMENEVVLSPKQA